MAYKIFFSALCDRYSFNTLNRCDDMNTFNKIIISLYLLVGVILNRSLIGATHLHRRG